MTSTMNIIDIQLHFCLMKSPTVPAIFVINLLQGAKDQGYDIKKLLRDCGISPTIVEQPKSRISLPGLGRLAQAVIELMDDEYCGLLESPQRQNTYRMACYASLHARDIGEALGIMLEFFNLFDNSLQYSVAYQDDLTLFRLSRHPDRIIRNNYAIEYTLSTMHRTLCWLAKAQIRLLGVDVDYPAPDYEDEYRYMFYGAPISFRQQYCTLIFSNSDMRLKSVRKLPDLEKFLTSIPLTLLLQMVDPAQLSAQIRAWLERQLSEFRLAPGIDMAAEHFRLHPQTLRRHLKKEGTSYKQTKWKPGAIWPSASLIIEGTALRKLPSRWTFPNPRPLYEHSPVGPGLRPWVFAN